MPRRPAPPSRRPAVPARPAEDRARSARSDGARGSVRPGAPRGSTRRVGPEPRRVGSPTVRVLVLGVVLLVAFAVLFPTVRAYLGQRDDLASLDAQVLDAEAAEEELRAELARWQDPAYVTAQARERLQFVMPGETSYRVIDPEVVVEVTEVADDPVAAGPALPFGAEELPWYTAVWGSVVESGLMAVPDPDAVPDAVPDAPAPEVPAPDSPAPEAPGSSGSEEASG